MHMCYIHAYIFIHICDTYMHTFYICASSVATDEAFCLFFRILFPIFAENRRSADLLS